MNAAHVVHHMPGRIRLRVPAKRHDVAWFDTFKQAMEAIDIIDLVDVNPLTASILIAFSGPFEHLMQRLVEHGLEVGVKPETAGKTLNVRPFNIVTGRSIGPMFMAGSVLAAFGIVQAMRGKILVPSITALWYAGEAFRLAKRS